MVFVHHLVEEIVDVELRAGIDDSLHLVEHLVEVYALGICYVVEGYLAVDALYYAHLEH